MHHIRIAIFIYRECGCRVRAKHNRNAGADTRIGNESRNLPGDVDQIRVFAGDNGKGIHGKLVPGSPILGDRGCGQGNLPARDLGISSQTVVENSFQAGLSWDWIKGQYRGNSGVCAMFLVLLLSLVSPQLVSAQEARGTQNTQPAQDAKPVEGQEFSGQGAPAGIDLSDTAKKVVGRAIQAHGGRELLNKNRADKVKLQGKMVVGKVEIPYTAETLVQLPGQFKNTIQFNQGKKEVALTQVIDGTRAAIWVNGEKQKLSTAQALDLRQTLDLNRAMRLVGLLEDSAYNLKYLGQTEEGEQKTHVVRVLRKDMRELRMFFDAKTGLLVKTEHPVDFQGKQMLQEEHYSDFRDLSGFRRPVRMTVYRGGQKILESALTQVSYFESIEPSRFDPEQKP